MAYISQERKAQIAPVVKSICRKYGVKGTLSVNNHRTLVLNVSQGDIDFIYNYNKTVGEYNRSLNKVMEQNTSGSISVNPYHFQKHFSGQALNFLKEVYAAMMVGNHDRSDIQSDYFDVGWYVDINIGRWNRPYALVK
jgi:hypothetical protein